MVSKTSILSQRQFSSVVVVIILFVTVVLVYSKRFGEKFAVI